MRRLSGSPQQLPTLCCNSSHPSISVSTSISRQLITSETAGTVGRFEYVCACQEIDDVHPPAVLRSLHYRHYHDLLRRAMGQLLQYGSHLQSQLPSGDDDDRLDGGPGGIYPGHDGQTVCQGLAASCLRLDDHIFSIEDRLDDTVRTPLSRISFYHSTSQQGSVIGRQTGSALGGSSYSITNALTGNDLCCTGVGAVRPSLWSVSSNHSGICSYSQKDLMLRSNRSPVELSPIHVPVVAVESPWQQRLWL